MEECGSIRKSFRTSANLPYSHSGLSPHALPYPRLHHQQSLIQVLCRVARGNSDHHGGGAGHAALACIVIEWELGVDDLRNGWR